jgi:hypothetical protein
MEPDPRMIIRFLCKEGVLADDIHKRFEIQFGEDARNQRSVGWGAKMFGKEIQSYKVSQKP